MAHPTEAELTDLRERISWITGVLEIQQGNGLVTTKAAADIVAKVIDAQSKLDSDFPAANQAAYEAQIMLIDVINSHYGARWQWLLYLYGLHVWVVLGASALLLLGFIYTGLTRFNLFTFASGTSTVDISADVIVWGGLGGCAFAIFHLRNDIYKLQLSRYYAVYYMVYPVAGTIFGLALVVMMAGGLLVVDATPGYALFAAVTFIAGLLQQWALKVLVDLAEAIHSSQSS